MVQRRAQQQSEVRFTSSRDDSEMEGYKRNHNRTGCPIATRLPPTIGGGARRKRNHYVTGPSITALLFLAASIPLALTQACIPLSGSMQCPAFNTSSISTGPTLTSFFPFLSFVSNTQEFDERLSQYITSNYVQLKYQQLLGCNNVTLTNTTAYYARYTTSMICNSIVQNSIQPCSLSAADSRPMCADSCAQQAISEEHIAVNPELCGTSNQNYLTQIRADFTNCALPADSLSGSCVTGEQNEPDDCGFSTNLPGLCSYCASSSPNATDSCCIGSNVTSRCTGVTLPAFVSMPPLFPSSTSTSTSTAPTASATNANSTAGGAGGAANSPHNLSGGQIAGIVIGSILGAALLLALLFLCCICLRRRRRTTPHGSVFNQPSPKRGVQPQMSSVRDPGQVAPGGRVARMSALEGTSSSDPQYVNPVLAAERRRLGENSDSDLYGDSPGSRGRGGPPVTGRRNGSLSSNSVFGGGIDDGTSPVSGSGAQFSSPDGIGSGESEQLMSFKDYYSPDEIHPNDKVATLWAYQPRAGDEFELERGDMLKVVGIWDDGWATGVRINDRAEDYDSKRKELRDSGVSNGTGRRDASPPPMGEIKAFPLVCVCLPEHWKKTVEGEGSQEGGLGGPPSGHGL